MTGIASAAGGYHPTDDEIAEVLAWFARYDALVAAKDLDGMADMALFPINEVTDDGAGNASAGSCDRARFLEQMREVVAAAGEAPLTSVRHPTFLSPSLGFVVTDAEITVEGTTHQMRYGDLLVKVEGRWLFQTMVAGGWQGQM